MTELARAWEPRERRRAPRLWTDLLASALVGTARGGGDAEALLDAAAAQDRKSVV